MSDPEDTSPLGDYASGGEQEIAPGQDVDSDTPQLGDQEMGNGTELQDASRRGDLLEKEAIASEASSIDASLVESIPRRAGSPVESLGSGRVDSIQVGEAAALLRHHGSLIS
jgi:hypothetical protein